MNSFLRDLRYAARVLLRSPVATVIAILALALGIGVNAGSFISTSALILHPLPYPRLERIVTVWETLPKLRTERSPLAPADFIDFRKESRSYEKIGAYREWNAALTGTGDAERVAASEVTPGFFEVLGRKAALGRIFSGDEGETSHARVAVISQGFWKTHFAGARDVIGKPISLDGKSYAVVGVMPGEFNYPLQNEVWAPLTFEAAESQERGRHDVLALALLKPNVPAAQASAEAATIASRLAQRYPGTNEARSIQVTELRESSDEVTKHFVLMLVGAAGFVLLLACANIGNLQLARAASRQKEIAVRAALGASRRQIARQLLAEGLLISLAAGGLGLLLASWNLDLNRSDISAGALRIVPGLADMHVDTAVVLLTLAVSLAAGILCSLPAISQLVFRRMGMDLNDALQERGSSQSNLPNQSRVRSGLVVLELSLALVLLVGAGLMVNTFKHMLDVYQGFDPKNILSMQVSLPPTTYRQPEQIRLFYDRVLERLERVPGVKAASVATNLGPAEGLSIEGHAAPRAGEPRPGVMAVSSQYLAALHIAVLKGRALSEQDKATSPGVVVVSENIARHYWPNSDPIGKRIKLNGQRGWLTVVGVCGNIIEDWFSGQASTTAYVPYTQAPAASANFLVRTAGDPLQAAAAARAEIRSVDKNLPVYDVETMEKAMADERGGVRAAAKAMTTYAIVALLLAATGIYGVISYVVAARIHEIGVRMALGASRHDILIMILRQAAGLIGIGLAFGLPLTVFLAQGMSSALYGVVQVSPATIAEFTGILVATALAASYLPCRRATHADPMTALRTE